MLSRRLHSLARNRAIRAALLGTALALAFPATAGAGSDSTAKQTTPGIRQTSPTYEVSVGLDGEIYPVFANYASLRRVRERRWGTVSVKVTNSTSRELRNRITVKISGWSDEEIQLAELAAGETRTFLFAPTFLPRLYQNREIVAATAQVTIFDPSGAIVHEETVPVRLRSVDDLYWGRDFEYAPFIASWVTPHNADVEQVLSRAKEYASGRRLPGYESNNSLVQERSTIMQARAIYRALQERGVSYVKSSMTLGRHEEVSERVRMPSETLQQVSANCIDGAVMYAALFENLGMEPEIILVPGHAVVAVRVARGSNKYLYIETSLTGRSSFDRAVSSAERGLAKFPRAQQIRVSIREARLDGIYPMPEKAPAEAKGLLDASKAIGRPRS